MTRDMKEAQLRDRHAYTSAELTEERGAHDVTKVRLGATERRAVTAEAALAKSNELLIEANRKVDGLQRDLAESHRAASDISRAAQRALHAIEARLLLLAVGEAVGPRVAPPNPSPEQIERDFLERLGGR